MRKQDSVHIMKSFPYSLSTDGSNDADMKQYQSSLRINGLIVNDVLGVPNCEGRSTGENIVLTQCKVIVIHVLIRMPIRFTPAQLLNVSILFQHKTAVMQPF